jgi:hypothetical protein
MVGDLKADNDDESASTVDVTPLTSAASSPSLGPSFSTPSSLDDSDLGYRLGDETTKSTMTMVNNAGNGAVISSDDGGGWKTMPASKKAQRTCNPIRAIMDPIMATAQTSREDGKSQISLAVSARGSHNKSRSSNFV